MANRKGGQRVEKKHDIMLHMEHVYQCGAMVARLSEKAGLSNSSSRNVSCLSRAYMQIVQGISRKAVQRMSPTLKRSICRRCRQLLIPGFTSTKHISKGTNGVVISIRCIQCRNQIVYHLPKKSRSKDRKNTNSIPYGEKD